MQRYLDDRLPGTGFFEIERHVGGHSCETFFLSRDGHEWVLRRPPLDVYLPTAHDVAREFRVLDAIRETPVRAPRPVLFCSDEAVIGAPFYVMERVHGTVMRRHAPDGFDPAAITGETIEALAEIHDVDWGAVGLQGFGKPQGYLERQMRRWSGQLELAASVTASSREVPDMWTVRDWLQANLPASGRAAIVHGDYKLDNLMWSEEPPARLVSIFDWEMSTIGDPLADLGWLVSSWTEAGDPPDEVRDDLSAVTAGEGFPSRDELAALYADRTGRDVSNLRWYVVLAWWKLAVLLEGSYGRHLMGTTDDPLFARLETGVPSLALRARELTG